LGAYQHLDPGDHADVGPLLLLQPSQGNRFALQHVDQDVGVEPQHQRPLHS
jgi:hypothetical protein